MEWQAVVPFIKKNKVTLKGYRSLISTKLLLKEAIKRFETIERLREGSTQVDTSGEGIISASMSGAEPTSSTDPHPASGIDTTGAGNGDVHDDTDDGGSAAIEKMEDVLRSAQRKLEAARRAEDEAVMNKMCEKMKETTGEESADVEKAKATIASAERAVTEQEKAVKACEDALRKARSFRAQRQEQRRIEEQRRREEAEQRQVMGYVEELATLLQMAGEPLPQNGTVAYLWHIVEQHLLEAINTVYKNDVMKRQDNDTGVITVNQLERIVNDIGPLLDDVKPKDATPAAVRDGANVCLCVCSCSCVRVRVRVCVCVFVRVCPHASFVPCLHHCVFIDPVALGCCD